MAQSSQSKTSQSSFCIHVLRTALNTTFKRKSSLHIAVTLPSTRPFRSHSLQSDCNLEWDRRYEFISLPSHEVKFQLVVKELFGPTIHGEARIRIEELLKQCDSARDCTLELLKPSSGKSRGFITVRLERRSDTTPSHKLINEELSRLEQDDRLNKYSLATEDDGDLMEALSSLLDLMKPFIRVIGTASTIHPIFENAWESVSSLCKTYQKMKMVDVDIKELLRTVRNALDFVRNPKTAKYILSRSERTVEEILRIISESTRHIREYIDATKIGRVWKTDPTIHVLRKYKRQVESLSVELHGHTIVNITNKLESTGSKRSHVVVPPPPSDIFTGREDYLAQIEESFDLTKTSMELKKQRIFVLYGIGGMGKTQLALKFREQNSDKFTKQYMIDASSEESIDLSFASIGDDLGIPDADRSKVTTRLIQLKEDWLLIYDNADNPKMYLPDFIPRVGHGNIIITTRNAELSSLAPNGNVEVLNLDFKPAIHLLLLSSRLQESEENQRLALTLVEKFGCLALAIVQAGSYIASRHLDLQKYLEMYEDSQSELLRTKLGSDVAYKSPVFTTWEISYSGLSGHAQTLLHICSFLYRDHITKDMIRLAVTSHRASEVVRDQKTNDPNVPSDSPIHTNPTPSRSLFDLIRWLGNGGKWDDYRFGEVMYDLCSYSLLRQLGGVYSIHPLVHEWARDRLEDSLRETVQLDAWLLLYYSTRSYRDSNYTFICRMLLPHMSTCGRPTHVTIMEAFSDVYTACGRWKDAEILQSYVVERRMVEVGGERTDMLWSKTRLATIYWNQGRWAEAEKLDVEVLEARKQLLGYDHPDTLSSMNNLAVIYYDQGRWVEAEKLQVEVLEARKQLLGPDHPDTLTTMANLALTHQNQGRWAEAEKLEVDVLEATKQLLGPDHPDTLTSVHNLASTHRNQGRWVEAEKMEVEVLEARKQLLGPDHPDTLTSMASLASTYRNQGRWAEAEKLQLEVLEARKQLLGPDHPDTLVSIANLAKTLQCQGRFNESIALLCPTVESSNHVLGPEHPETLQRSRDLLSIYRELGRLDEADVLEATFQAVVGSSVGSHLNSSSDPDLK